jgi:hypothetical protein
LLTPLSVPLLGIPALGIPLLGFAALAFALLRFAPLGVPLLLLLLTLPLGVLLPAALTFLFLLAACALPPLGFPPVRVRLAAAAVQVGTRAPARLHWQRADVIVTAAAAVPVTPEAAVPIVRILPRARRARRARAPGSAR